ncbi:phosphoribosyltransferase [Kitasatospora sp. NPDC050543]|uniref:phosphoribosyltransferase n=1 Tax=Kitasatospora sp. NPDC050543 TaxID=3364054 RepID=UPI00379984DC
MPTRFANRQDAGRRLAARLTEVAAGQGLPDPIVLALPPGGVPVAAEVARALGAPLNVLIARRIGAPGQPDAWIGAIAASDPPLFNRRALRTLGLRPRDLDADVTRERAELHRRERLYRHGRPAPPLEGRTVVLVDDGLTAGAAARAALRFVRRAGPARLILAVPVCDARVADELAPEADDLLCLHRGRYLHAVGPWYEDFREVSDREAIDILEHRRAAG